MRHKARHTTITIPVKLRDRMTSFQDGHAVNWSKIACRAFRKHIQKIEEEADE